MPVKILKQELRLYEYIMYAQRNQISNKFNSKSSIFFAILNQTKAGDMML